MTTQPERETSASACTRSVPGYKQYRGPTAAKRCASLMSVPVLFGD